MSTKPKMVKPDQEWKKELPAELYRVAREKGTEAPFSGKYTYSKEKGIYQCSACGNPLFSSETKFDSETGWPSFYQPVNTDSVEEHEDRSLGMVRTEITCGRCGAHLGHVFEDGPKPTGKRYCMNSVCLNLNLADQLQK